jgi:hypothetical protein
LNQLASLWWLLVILGPLLIIQSRLHRELQAVFLLVTRRIDVSLILVSIIFLPGVLLHEVSHYLVARLLGVPTGKISIIPKIQTDGRVRLGYVETTHTDILRETLIGAAPLIAGVLFIAFVSVSQLGLPAIWENIEGGELLLLNQTLPYLYNSADFWIWFYLVFAVSSTMMPSRSDRRAWMPVAIIVAVLLSLALLGGAGPWMWDHLASPLNQIFQVLVLVFGISLVIHMILIFPLWISRKLLVRLTGMKVM